jgi:aconitate hydratase
VLSGNRNFEGRVNPDVRANYLASPPLVVAYALAGSMKIDLTTEPLGTGKDGKPVFLKDIWPTNEEIAECIARTSPRRCSPATPTSSRATRTGRPSRSPGGQTYAWDRELDLRAEPALLRTWARPRPRSPTSSARVLGVFGDKITTDHISPGRFDQGGLARRRLSDRSTASPSPTSTSYGARRGNHEVMMRGTFANIRIRNQ